MRHSYLTLIAILLASLCGPLAPPVAGQAPINSYTAVQIGGAETSVRGINNAGQVVGQMAGRAFVWQNGVMTDLGASIAYGINNVGQVVGSAYPHAFLWSAETGMQDLGNLAGYRGAAYGVNDSGLVVGTFEATGGVLHAFLWKNGVMFDLGVPAGFAESDAAAINASGQVVGYARNYPTAFRWTPTVPNGTSGTFSMISTAGSQACAINASGAVVGQADAMQAVLWDSLGAHALDGYIANAINGSGVVGGAGYYGDYFYDWLWDLYYPLSRGFVWDGVNGRREPDSLAGMHLPGGSVQGINASGQIALTVHGYEMGPEGAVPYDNAYLLSPSPLPLPPSNFGRAVGDGRVSLGWSPSIGATSYTLTRSTSNSSGFTTIFSGNATGYTDTNVINGTTYYYKVSASNSYGRSADNGPIDARPVTAPAAPTGLTATAGVQQVSLSWNASTWAEYYIICRGTSPGVYDAGGDVVFGTTYLDTGTYDEWGDFYPLTPGVTLYYTVVAVNVVGMSGYSVEASATPLAPPIPGAPTGLTGVAGDGYVDLLWNASAGADYYVLKVSATSGGPYAEVDYTPQTAYTSAYLTNGKTYHFVISAVNAGGESPNSAELAIAPVGPPPPDAPTGLTATAGDAMVSLTWTASAGALSYTVKRSLTSSGPYQWRYTTNQYQTSFTDSGVTNGTTYYYVVSARNDHGESADSNPASATPVLPPPPAAPTGLSATAAKSKVNLRWTQSSTPGITLNSIYRATTSGGPYAVLYTSSKPIASYADASVAVGKTYYYVVTALKGSQESSRSNQASAKAR